MKSTLHIILKVAGSALLSLILYYAIWIATDNDLRYLWPFTWGEMIIDYMMCFVISLVVCIVYWRSYVRILRERDRFKLKSLENQINPHFVFNNFSILSELIDEDPQRAQAFLLNLSKVYRYNLTNVEKTLVPIADELRFLDQYAQILMSRYGDTFSLKIDEDVRSLSGNIAPCALQMLVENALKHNEHTRQHPLLVSITTESNRIVVANVKQPLAGSSDSTNIGTHNLIERYSLLSGKTIEIHETDTIYQTSLPIL